MTVIGLTGGTGSGKTSALYALRSLGAEIIDCDELYHELLETNDALTAEIGARFEGVVTDGKLDRRALGRIVFANEKALAELNAITHGFVRDEVAARLKKWSDEGKKLAAVDAIALFESRIGELCDWVVGITAPPDVRVKRITARDGVSEESARLRIAAQKPDSWFEERCDYVLKNDGGTAEEFENKCRVFFTRLLGGRNHA